MKLHSKKIVCCVAVVCASLSAGSLFAEKTPGQKVDKAIDKVEEKVDAGKKKAEDLANKAKEKAENARDKAQDKAENARDKVKDKIHETAECL